MCDPVSAGLAITAVGTGASLYSGKRTGDKQQAAALEAEQRNQQYVDAQNANQSAVLSNQMSAFTESMANKDRLQQEQQRQLTQGLDQFTADNHSAGIDEAKAARLAQSAAAQGAADAGTTDIARTKGGRTNAFDKATAEEAVETTAQRNELAELFAELGALGDSTRNQGQQIVDLNTSLMPIRQQISDEQQLSQLRQQLASFYAPTPQPNLDIEIDTSNQQIGAGIGQGLSGIGAQLAGQPVSQYGVVQGRQPRTGASGRV